MTQTVCKGYSIFLAFYFEKSSVILLNVVSIYIVEALTFLLTEFQMNEMIEKSTALRKESFILT